jgi:hypothetical protein
MIGASSLPLVVLLLTSVMACHSQTPPSAPPLAAKAKQEWPVNIQSQYDEQLKRLEPARQSKDYPGKKLDIMQRILEKLPPEQFSFEVDRIRKVPEDYEQMDSYNQILLEAIFNIYDLKNDRISLVHLLSAKCPRFVAGSAVEFGVFFDSYQGAVDDGERRYLLRILRRAFDDISEKYTDDDDFLRESRQWYTANAPHLSVNPYYHPAGIMPAERKLFDSKSN